MLINKTSKQNQSGVVSLIVVSILAVVLGLIAVGFSQLSNRELSQASARELSTQAFYAAEAGLNDAVAYLQSPGAVAFPGCSWPPSADPYFVKDLSSTPGLAQYTCVSIADTTPTLFYQLRAGQSVTIKIGSSNVSNLAKLFLSWQNQGKGPWQPLGGLGSLPQESSINNPAITGVLRTAIYAVPSGVTNADNNALVGFSRNYFMYPNGTGGPSSPGSIDYNSGGNGRFVPGNCNNGNKDPVTGSSTTASYCNSVINGLSGSSNTYYLQLTALYTSQNVTIQAEDGGGNALTFKDIQGVVDVTGKGTDVLQRIRARIDLNHNYQYPDFALQSMEALCKGFTVEVPAAGNYGAVLSNSFPNPDGSCAQPNNTNGAATGSGGDLGPH